MKSYNLSDYLDGPPISELEITAQKWALLLEEFEKELQEINALQFYQADH